MRLYTRPICGIIYSGRVNAGSNQRAHHSAALAHKRTNCGKGKTVIVRRAPPPTPSGPRGYRGASRSGRWEKFMGVKKTAFPKFWGTENRVRTSDALACEERFQPRCCRVEPLRSEPRLHSVAAGRHFLHAPRNPLSRNPPADFSLQIIEALCWILCTSIIFLFNSSAPGSE